MGLDPTYLPLVVWTYEVRNHLQNQPPVEVAVVAFRRVEEASSTPKATGLLEVVTEAMRRRTASWTQQARLSGSKRQLSALLTATRVVVWEMYVGLVE